MVYRVQLLDRALAPVPGIRERRQFLEKALVIEIYYLSEMILTVVLLKKRRMQV